MIYYTLSYHLIKCGELDLDLKILTLSFRFFEKEYQKITFDLITLIFRVNLILESKKILIDKDIDIYCLLKQIFELN